MNLWSTRALFVRPTAGAIGIRLSLRPLFAKEGEADANLGRIAPREHERTPSRRLKFESDVSARHCDQRQRRPRPPKLYERRRKQSMPRQEERWIASLTLAMTTRGGPVATPPSPAHCCRTRRDDRRAAASRGWRRGTPPALFPSCRSARSRRAAVGSLRVSCAGRINPCLSAVVSSAAGVRSDGSERLSLPDAAAGHAVRLDRPRRARRSQGFDRDRSGGARHLSGDASRRGVAAAVIELPHTPASS